jgi:hypothetical protein
MTSSHAQSPLVCLPLPDRLSVHRGAATLEVAGTVYSGFAEFFLPASAQAIAAFCTEKPLTDQDFAGRLTIDGDWDSVPFHFECPHCFVRPQTARGESGAWSLISPVNGPCRIDYRGLGAATKTVVLLNNFDYRDGDPVTSERGWTRVGTPFAAELGDRRVEFRRHANYELVRPFADASLVRVASVVECSFDVLLDESDAEVLEFATDIAGLSTIAMGGGVSVAMVEFADQSGRVVRRVVPQPVMTPYRQGNGIIGDFYLPEYFCTTFRTFVMMPKSHAPWRRLASYCGSLEAAPFIEQKFASLITAIEFFMRNSLIERGKAGQGVARLDFPKLVGAVRRDLGWDIPKHYMAKEAIRLWRNAVMHGGEWPSEDSTALRKLFDKWRLFLFRRVLIRLGYAGKIDAPHKGWMCSSDVGDFSEAFNSFEPADPRDPNPMSEFIRRLRESQSRGKASAQSPGGATYPF